MTLIILSRKYVYHLFILVTAILGTSLHEHLYIIIYYAMIVKFLCIIFNENILLTKNICCWKTKLTTQLFFLTFNDVYRLQYL